MPTSDQLALLTRRPQLFELTTAIGRQRQPFAEQSSGGLERVPTVLSAACPSTMQQASQSGAVMCKMQQIADRD